MCHGQASNSCGDTVVSYSPFYEVQFFCLFYLVNSVLYNALSHLKSPFNSFFSCASFQLDLAVVSRYPGLIFSSISLARRRNLYHFKIDIEYPLKLSIEMTLIWTPSLSIVFYIRLYI